MPFVVDIFADVAEVVFINGRAVRFVWATDVRAVAVADLVAAVPAIAPVIAFIKRQSDVRAYVRKVVVAAPGCEDEIEVLALIRLAEVCFMHGFNEKVGEEDARDEPFGSFMVAREQSFQPFYDLDAFDLPSTADGKETDLNHPHQVWRAGCANPFVSLLVAHFPNWHPGEAAQRRTPKVRFTKATVRDLCERVAGARRKSGSLAGQFAAGAMAPLALPAPAAAAEPTPDDALTFEGKVIAVRRLSSITSCLWLEDLEAACGLPRLPDDLFGLAAAAIVVRNRHAGAMGRPKGAVAGRRRSLWIKADRLSDLADLLPDELSRQADALSRLDETLAGRLADGALLPDGARWLSPIDGGREIVVVFVVGEREAAVRFDKLTGEPWLDRRALAALLSITDRWLRKRLGHLERSERLPASERRIVAARMPDGQFQLMTFFSMSVFTALARDMRSSSFWSFVTWMAEARPAERGWTTKKVVLDH